MKQNVFLNLLGCVQILLALRVIPRLFAHTNSRAMQPVTTPCDASIAVIVPVLNEYERLAPCLDGLLLQGEEVTEIIVVDGGSQDGTQRLVHTYMQRDLRIRLVDASPIPPHWNGKVWGLQAGLNALQTSPQWLLTLDADTRPRPALARTLVHHARQKHVAALSIATLQEIDSLGESLLHPALLTTLVYRFGTPGTVFRKVSEVQANGQCFLFRRDVLEFCDGFLHTRNSICEDITIARLLVDKGQPVGFYEAGDLISVRMYANWQEMWRNWTRSLPMHDQFSGIHTFLGWLEVMLLQALPLPLVLLFILLHHPSRVRWLLTLNGILTMLRIGVLVGTARAYQQRRWTYWLSPMYDIPVAIQLARMALRRRHVWRGRSIVRGSAQ